MIGTTWPPGADRDLAWLAYAALTRQLPRARVVELLLQLSHTHATGDHRADCRTDHQRRQAMR